ARGSWEHPEKKFPAAGLWPARPAARAHARAIASEMHAGFVSLRRQLPMNIARPVKFRTLDAGAAKDVARIDAIWGECRSKYGSGGPFLFCAILAPHSLFSTFLLVIFHYD